MKYYYNKFEAIKHNYKWNKTYSDYYNFDNAIPLDVYEHIDLDYTNGLIALRDLRTITINDKNKSFSAYDGNGAQYTRCVTRCNMKSIA